MIVTPSYLKENDKVGLVAPARKISFEEVEKFIIVMQNNGFNVVYSEYLFGEHNQYSGSDELRANDFQNMLDDNDIKAIVCARGGYGTLRIIDNINFDVFVKNPKWIIGYSDITVLHCHINSLYNIKTLHATMPINVRSIDDKPLKEMIKVIKGGIPFEYSYDDYNSINREGEVKGIIVGGNLSVLYSLVGSVSFQVDFFKDKILFIEDLDEYLYHIDRIMISLKRAGVLEKLKGLIVGGMTEMKDNTVPFGKDAYSIIKDAVKEYDYPVSFGFPAGHIENNMPIVLNNEILLSVKKNYSRVKFL